MLRRLSTTVEAIEFGENLYSRTVQLTSDVFKSKFGARELRSLIRRWETHDGVALIALEGDYGSFHGDHKGSLDQVYHLYRKIVHAKTPVVAIVDGLVTSGGLGLLGKRAVSSPDTVLAPPLHKDCLAELPRFIDGVMGFKLAKAGAYGRAVALSGIPVNARSLARCRFVSHVVSKDAMPDLLTDMQALAADPDIFQDNLSYYLDLKQAASGVQYYADDDIDTLASLCFEPTDLPDIVRLLEHADHPLAQQALDTINAAPVHAAILTTYLNRCRDIRHHDDCANFERQLNLNLLHQSKLALDRVDSYFP